MKFICSLGLAVALASVAFPQSPLNGPDVEVIQSKWERVTGNLKLDEDPLSVNEREAKPQESVKQIIVDNPARVAATQPTLPIPIAGTGSANLRHPFVLWQYQIRVKNTGTKTIRKLVWHYAYSKSEQADGRDREFSAKKKIGPGATTKLVVGSGPPSGVVDVNDIAKDQTPEQVIITRVEYADGSVWLRRP